MNTVKALACNHLSHVLQRSLSFAPAPRLPRWTMQRIRPLAVLSVLIMYLLTPMAASAQQGNPGVLPPNAKPHGKSYGEWSAEWTKWALAQPVDTNPVLDPTGAYCAQGQSGKVWFLAGTVFDPSSTEPVIIERTCTVPTGTNLFFPILNYFWITTPGDPDDKETISAILAAAFDELLANANPAVTIDGKVVAGLDTPSSYRVTPLDLFDAPMPLNNIFGVDDTLCQPYGSDQLLCSPSWSDGLFLMLAPLSAGQHTITIATTWFEVTYDLTVQGGNATKKAAAEPADVGMNSISPTQQNVMFLPALSH